MRGWIKAMRAEGHPIPALTRSGRHDLLGDKDNALPVGRARAECWYLVLSA
jgi:hypothetical protein